MEKSGSSAGLLEAKARQLFFEAGARIKPLVRSFVLHDDRSLEPRRGRQANDLHLFLEVEPDLFYHLRAYIRHMLESGWDGKTIFLTGYRQTIIARYGGTHALRQGYYLLDADVIVNEIRAQNTDLFGK